MPSQRRFEGPALEPLLEQVRSEIPPTATIIEANKVRRGGIGGFFAKESFEIVVELPGDPEALEDPEGPEALIAGDDAEREEFEPLVSGGWDAGAPLSLDELVERVSADDEASAGFDRVMAGELLKQGEPWPATEAIAAASMPRPRTARVDRNPFAAVEAPRPTLALREQPSGFVPAVPTPGQRCRAVQAHSVLALGLPDHLVAAAWRVAGPTSAQLVEALERLPAAAPLPSAGGSVIAVVGAHQDALELATGLAVEAGLGEEDVFFASDGARRRGVFAGRQLSGPRVAAERQRAWQRRAAPVVVAVDAAVHPRTGAWANGVLDALEPAQVWGSVRADRKPEDIVAWAQVLGGLDALAVHALDETMTPATVLRAGIPVGRIDGHKATPARWAAVLTERLVAA